MRGWGDAILEISGKTVFKVRAYHGTLNLGTDIIVIVAIDLLAHGFDYLYECRSRASKIRRGMCEFRAPFTVEFISCSISAHSSCSKVCYSISCQAALGLLFKSESRPERECDAEHILIKSSNGKRRRKAGRCTAQQVDIQLLAKFIKK